MSHTIALAACLAIFQPPPAMEFLNVRTPLGLYGANRPDPRRFLPGDNFILAFDLSGLKITDPGRALFSLEGELFDSTGKSVFKAAPKETESFSPLGGNRVPAYAAVNINPNYPPGKYLYKLTATDLLEKKSATLSYPLEIMAKSLGFILWHMTYEDNFPAPPMAVPGQVLILRYCVIGFETDPKTRKPNLSFSMRILDEAGQPTLAKPFIGEAKDISEEFKDILPITFPIRPNKPGKYKIEVTLVDNLTRNRVTIKQECSLWVYEPR
ncbi:MAG: hypothetical protein EXR99_09320 [Gemmataceae bacterium]|nr:hypothetical protein [Gemmataceae bacterium]